MESVKTILLGIASLIIASFGMMLWIDGAGIGYIVAFFAFMIVGIFLCIKGYFSEK